MIGQDNKDSDGLYSIVVSISQCLNPQRMLVMEGMATDYAACRISEPPTLIRAKTISSYLGKCVLDVRQNATEQYISVITQSSSTNRY